MHELMGRTSGQRKRVLVDMSNLKVQLVYSKSVNVQLFVEFTVS